MTGTEVKNKVERYINTTCDEDLILDAIEDAINWLGSMGYIIDTVLLEGVEADEFYELPSDLIKVLKVEKPDDKEYYYDYLIDGDLIRFADDGKYRIFAQKNPSMISAIGDELNMHPMLENCIVTYAKGFIKVTIDDSSQDGHRLLQKFEKDSLKAYLTLKRNQKTPANFSVIRHA